MENFELPYSAYLEQGRAWSPVWDETRRGSNCWLVLAPPSVETIESESDYFALLARRIEWMIEDWIENYGRELPMRVDLEDEEAVRSGTIEMISRAVPPAIGMGLSDRQSNREISQAIACRELSPRLQLPTFPIDLPITEAGRFAYSVTKDVTLQGWLLETQP